MERQRAKRPPDAPGERAAHHFLRRVPVGADVIPRERYARAKSQRAAMPQTTAHPDAKAGSKGSAAWEPLGPGNVGGRTRALVVDPTNPSLLYAAGVSGGIWRSDNGGGSWRLLSDTFSNINVTTLAMDPNDAAVIYAGTGEVWLNAERPYSRIRGEGIYVTRDGGESWALLEATLSPDFQFVTRLRVSPDDSSRVWAATGTGLWTSEDAGATWSLALQPRDGAGRVINNGCNDIEFKPGDPDVVYVSCGSRNRNDRYHVDRIYQYVCPGDCEGRVYRNDDATGAGEWRAILSEPGMGRVELAVTRADPNVVYALGASLVPAFDRDGDGEGDYLNGLHAVFYSDDSGDTWRARVRNSAPNKLDSLLLSGPVNAHLAECGFEEENRFRAQGWYDAEIAVSPTDADVVFVGGIDWFRSDDGGRSWGLMSYWWLNPNGPNARNYAHADQHRLVFHPSWGNGLRGGAQTLFVTNDGGVYRTNNALAKIADEPLAACEPERAQVQWTSLNTGYGVTQFYHGVAYPDGTRYLGGTQDNGTIRGSDASGPLGWTEILGGDGAYSAIDPRNSQTLYASYQGVAIQKSIDGGATFNEVTTGLEDSGLFIMPYRLDPNNPDRLWTGGSRLWRSNNGAASWQAASAPLGEGFRGVMSAVAIAPGDADRLVAGNYFGLHRTDQATVSDGSTSLRMTSPRLGWPSSIEFDPNDPDVVYATYSTFGGTHVWQSTDGGTTWRDRDGQGSGRLPDLPVHALIVDPADSDHLVLGTDLGTFVSGDAGETWAAEDSAFEAAITERLALATETGADPLLFAFTHGRGVWRRPLTAPSPVAATRKLIDADTSGLWYDPAQSGHGLIVHVLDESRVLAYWFAYLDGRPTWFGGVGASEGANVEIPLQITRGGDFPPNFDADAIERVDWGSVTLSFIDDDRATVTWNGRQERYGNGSLELTRLAALADADEANTCLSGTWYHPDQSGHGLLLEVVGAGSQARVVATWFAYVDGRQTWLNGVGGLDGDRADIPLSIFRGGEFPPDFDPERLQQDDWGRLRIELADRDEIDVTWNTSYPGFTSGSLEMIRLASIRDQACER